MFNESTGLMAPIGGHIEDISDIQLSTDIARDNSENKDGNCDSQ